MAGGESTFLESCPETNLHPNENTALSATPGQEVWGLPGFPRGAERFLRAGWCEKRVGLGAEREKLGRKVSKLGVGTEWEGGSGSGGGKGARDATDAVH